MAEQQRDVIEILLRNTHPRRTRSSDLAVGAHDIAEWMSSGGLLVMDANHPTVERRGQPALTTRVVSQP